MALPIIIFFIALISAFGLVYYRLRQIQSGAYQTSVEEHTDKWIELSIENIRTHLVTLVRTMAHHILVELLRAWIGAGKFLKKTDRAIREKLMHLLHRNAAHNATQNGTPSHFLKRISQDKIPAKTPIKESIAEELANKDEA